MDYDDVVIGIMNRNHPANEIEVVDVSELEEANQNTWRERCAKWRLEDKVKTADELLEHLFTYASLQEHAYLKSKITEIRNILK